MINCSNPISILLHSMILKKQSPAPPPPSPTPPSSSKLSKIKFHFIYFLFFFLLCVSSWFFVLFFFLPPTSKHQPQETKHYRPRQQKLQNPSSKLLSVYIYDLPPEFNLGLLEDCTHLSMYTNMCPHVANHGLGQPLPDPDSGGPPAWFATNQFMAELIFHARIENHPLRTSDPSRATLFYVPFYGGLHASSKFGERNLTARDELAVRLVDYLRKQPTWRKNRGRDHFMVLGRTAWDFMRLASGPDFGANSLLNLPRVQSMSVLIVERNPWHKGSNQHGLPYPSYFHPLTSAQVRTWQTKMRSSDRPYLFSFIGAPRKGLEKAAIRDELIRQCGESTRCELLLCDKNSNNKCYKPEEVLRVMTRSDFCLQAPGDSFTRRSTFDAVLAGCVPVFFSRHTAYTQYGWFLPEEAGEYSVYIEAEEEGKARGVVVEEELLKIPRERVKRMRNRVIDLIPRVTYKHPNATEEGFKDAVDVALGRLFNSVLGHKITLSSDS